ncbi:GNAT family N-acetyltransferase [Polynucleobacter paneuropaeus]|nr:GNAT family N-acetyltransferase [Polynucleobacter paneuropaeus]
MIIRDAESSDSEDIFLWRNDPSTRSMSTCEQKVTMNEHEKWFINSLLNPERKLYIGVTEAIKVGICHFRYHTNKEFAEVSINLNPEVRGRNLSFELLKKSINKYKASNICQLKATIKKDNIPSIRIFHQCDFRKISEDSNFYVFTLLPNSL